MHSDKVTQLLKKAGWYEGRKIDISKQIAILEESGFEVFEKAKEFMAEYDGLTIPRIYDSDYSNGTRATDFYHFDVLKNTAWIYRNSTPVEIKNIAKMLTTHMNFRDRVFPIGELGHRDVPLYITKDGQIVSDRLLYGNTIEEGMENLLSGKHLGIIPELPPEDPVKAALQHERFKDLTNYYITDFSLDKENGVLSWRYESDSIKKEGIKNCTWYRGYAKYFVMITTKEDDAKKYTLYDARANFVFAYTLDENKIFTTETDFYVVDNLQFVAYDRWQDKLVVLVGDSFNSYKLYIYDLSGNMLTQIQPPEGLFISSAKIDTIGYILINCQPISQLNKITKENEVIYNVNYDKYTLVKDIFVN